MSVYISMECNSRMLCNDYRAAPEGYAKKQVHIHQTIRCRVCWKAMKEMQRTTISLLFSWGRVGPAISIKNWFIYTNVQ